MNDAVILSACRTSIGSFGGVFEDVSAADLGAVVIRAAISRADVTAGDLGDGAAALVIGTAAWPEADGENPVDPMIMRMGPAEAMRRAVTRVGLTLDALDVIELNEAFASQSLAVVRELGLDAKKVNVHGGAIALGHPIGASGARVLTTLVHTLQARGGGRGAASLCIGGGMGTAMVIEVA
jgi:acetyl-CoA C-acetyltransferase